MRFDHKNIEEEEVSGDINTIESGINQENLGIIFDMVSAQMYKNPIGSIVREITSNCFDSHIEAGVDDPVIIEIGTDEEGDFISFVDVGVGLSPDRIRKVYMNYFSSTKRETNEQIGGFGLGSKSPLAYADMFYINTVFNGAANIKMAKKSIEIMDYSDLLKPYSPEYLDMEEVSKILRKARPIEYQYVLHKGAKKPALDLLAENPVERRNGTEIRIYIKESDKWDNDSDINKFSKEIQKQLLYFDNVFVKITKTDYWQQREKLSNDWKILEFDTFKLRTDVYQSENNFVTNKMHICYGKVNYTIDWEEIKMAPIYTPVGIKFDIGDLIVTPNRESLRYTDEIKSKIINRIKEVSKELHSLFYAQNRDIEDLKEYFLRMNEKPSIDIPDEENPSKVYKLYVKNIKDIKTEYVFKPLQDIGALATGAIINSEEWGIQRTIENGKKSSSIYYREIAELIQASERGVIIKDNPSSFYKNRYINNCHLIRQWTLTTQQVYYKYLSFVGASRMHGEFGSGNHIDVGIAKKIYLYRKIIKAEMLKMFDIYEDIVVPKEFIAENMPKRASTAELRKAQKMIRIFDLGKDTWVDEKPIDILSHTENRKGKKGGLLIYGHRADKDMLEKAYLLLSQKDNFRNDYNRIDSARLRYRNFVRKFRDSNNVIRFDTMTDRQLEEAIDLKDNIESLKSDFRKNRRTTSYLNNKAARVIMIAKKDEHTLPPSSTVTHVGNLFSDNKLFREIATAALFEEFDFVPNYGRYDGSRQYESTFPERFFEVNTRIATIVGFLEKYISERTFTNAKTKKYSSSEVREEILNIASKANLFDQNIVELVEELRRYFEGVDMLKFMTVNANNKAYVAKYLKEHGKAVNMKFYTKGIIDENGKVLEKGSDPIIPDGDEEDTMEASQLLSKEIVPFSFFNTKVA